MSTTVKITTCWLIVLMLAAAPVPAQHDESETEQLFAMSLGELMDVELEIATAGKFPQKIAEIPASVVLIEREDIKANGFRSLAEILSHIPGLFPIDDYSWGGSTFGVRGFWTGVANRHIVILVNGVNQISDFESNYPLNRINVPVEAIDRIEVIRGPMSVIYGSGAFFGVINIITHEGLEDRPVSLASAGIGTRNRQRAVLRVGEKREDLQVVLNASLDRTDGPDIPLSDLMTNTNVLPAYGLDTGQRSGGQLENMEKYVNIAGKSDHLLFDFSYSETNKEVYLTAPSYSDGSLYSVRKTNAAVGYRAALSDRLSMMTKFSYHNASFGLDLDFLMPDYDLGQKLGESACEFEMDLFYKHNPRFDLTAGITHRSAHEIYNTLMSTTSTDPFLIHLTTYLANGTSLVNRAVFMQANVTPVKKLKIVAGLRLEQMPDYDIGLRFAPFDSTQYNGQKILYIGALQSNVVNTLTYSYDAWEVIPRLAVMYQISRSHIVKLLYGEAINRPSFQQNIDKFLGMQKDLEPEKIRTYEISYLGSICRGFTAGVNVFRNEMTDLLIRNHGFTADGAYYSYFCNAGKMQTYGTEITLMLEPISKRLLLEGSITYQETEDQNQPDMDVAYSPNWLGYLKARAKPGQHLTLGLTMRYVDRILALWNPVLANENGSAGRRIGEAAPGYVIVGGNIRVDDVFKHGIYLNLRGSNLLNKKFWYPTFTNNQWADRGTLGEMRSVLITLGYEF
ncbi:TonB-dependent receptor [bacterium]|nr:TonB-dependent receptor [bacterium]